MCHVYITLPYETTFLYKTRHITDKSVEQNYKFETHLYSQITWRCQKTLAVYFMAVHYIVLFYITLGKHLNLKRAILHNIPGSCTELFAAGVLFGALKNKQTFCRLRTSLFPNIRSEESFWMTVQMHTVCLGSKINASCLRALLTNLTGIKMIIFRCTHDISMTTFTCRCAS